MFGFLNVKKTTEAASATKRQQTSSQMPLRKSLRRKDICLSRFLIADKSALFWGGKCHKGHLLVRKRREH